MKKSIPIVVIIIIASIALFLNCASNNKRKTNEDLNKKMLEIKRMGDKKEVKAVKYLINEYLTSDSDAIRIEAARALGKIGDVKAMPVFEQALQTEKRKNILRETRSALELIIKANPTDKK